MKFFVSALIFVIFNVTLASAAEKTSASYLEKCRVPKLLQEPLSAGFPRDSALIPSTGTIRSIFLYVDFLDNQSQQSNETFTKNYASGAKKFLETQSYGRAKFTFDTAQKTFRIQKDSSVYGLIKDGQGEASELIQDAINAADSEVDFKNYNFVTVVVPKDSKSILFSGTITGGEGLFTSEERNFSSAIWIGKNKLSNFAQPGNGWSFYAHEIGHVLGLAHPYFQRDGGPGAIWDLMGNGGTSIPEFIGWHRFVLGWFKDSEVLCISKEDLTQVDQLILPISSRSIGIKIVIIRLNNEQAIVAELRRRTSYDKLLKSEEGVIVYRVDVSKGDDQGIITVLGRKGTKREGQTLESIRSGEKISYGGLNFQVTLSSKAGDTVRIWRVV